LPVSSVLQFVKPGELHPDQVLLTIAPVGRRDDLRVVAVVARGSGEENSKDIKDLKDSKDKNLRDRRLTRP
jgi:hypothetical protein